jgi:NAD(P)-dependent dehydrogenase (short-subunit alcohol dehydrogenase family)
MTNRLKGKVAVITGSGAGIGRAAALLMSAEGASIVVNDFGKDKTDDKYFADKVVAEIKATGGKAAANYDTVATMAGGVNIINSAIKNFGRIDILVNNAGNFVKVPTVDLTEAQWDSIINVHLKGLFACAQPALKEMLKQKSGRIINMSSTAAGFGAENVYCCAKAGVLGFTTSLAQEMTGTGITVNAVLPSAITNLFPSKVVTIPGVPAKPRKGPEQVAPIMAYLATDEAKDITGRFFKMGGGDFIIYPRPLRVPTGSPTPLYKKGEWWTVEDLIETVPGLLGNG